MATLAVPFLVRALSGVIFLIFFFSLFAWAPSWLIASILALILGIILINEWPQMNAWWLTPLFPIAPFILLIITIMFGYRDLLLLSLVSAATFDTGGYIFGKTLGTYNPFPYLSPNKTLEGTIGGFVLLFTVFFTLARYDALPLMPHHPFILTLFLGTAAFAGDLVVSALKRSVNIKDTGGIIPGHGGFLDRFDSIAMTISVIWTLVFIQKMVAWNEIIFLAYILLTAATSIVASMLGKEGLISFMTLQALLSNIFVLKQVTFFNLTTTATDSLSIGIALCLNLLQEDYESQDSKRALWVTFAGLAFFLCVSILHLAYIPATSDIMQQSYINIFSATPRILLVSFSAYFVSIHINWYLFDLLKRTFPQAPFVPCNYISTGIAQLIDTILFALGVFAGSGAPIHEIIFVSYSMKLVTLLIASPLTSLLRKLAFRLRTLHVSF